MSERQKKKLAQREANRLKKRMIEKVLSGLKTTSNVAFNLNFLVDGWLELESDPGTFSLLIEDFGCFGAQVDEIYDLDQRFEGPVFGFIFLFKWLNNHQNDRLRNLNKYTSSSSSTTTPTTTAGGGANYSGAETRLATSTTQTRSAEAGQQAPAVDDQMTEQWTYVDDENILSEMFFAKQMISNSCATHALISILLNCDYDQLNLGPTLSRLKENTKVMNPENKGYAIGNFPELAKAHNSHASYSSLYNRNRLGHSSAGMSYVISGNQRTNLQQQNLHDAYHFVSYVPINNRLYELDGLKNYPIDHGPFSSKEDWTEKFRKVIKQRLSANKADDKSASSNEIRYSLMAVVPDKRVCLRSHLRNLKHHRKVVQDGIERLTKRIFTPLHIDTDIPHPPYSPLSNGTMTASEVGSVYNSPRTVEESYFSDEDNKMDKYFFIKFDKQATPTSSKEDNLEPAHKNCIIDVKSLTHDAMDLSSQIDSKPPLELKVVADDCGEEQNDVTTNAIPPNDTSIISEPVTNKQEEKKEQAEEEEEQNSKESDLNQANLCGETSTTETQNHLESPTNNGLDTDNKEGPADKDDSNNEMAAHGNLMYNLSTKPPFDFNIIDELQHVHIGKSTLKDMKDLSKKLDAEIGKVEFSLREELDKRKRYKIDNLRRTHNYEPFIMTFLSMLARQGKLADLIEKDLGLVPDDSVFNSVKAEPTPCKTIQPSNTTNTNTPVTRPTSNGSISKGNLSNASTPRTTATSVQKPKYKYVSTGRPVGRPRKNPLVAPPVKNSTTK